jgi:hypothetical protein
MPRPIPQPHEQRISAGVWLVEDVSLLDRHARARGVQMCRPVNSKQLNGRAEAFQLRFEGLCAERAAGTSV